MTESTEQAKNSEGVRGENSTGFSLCECVSILRWCWYCISLRPRISEDCTSQKYSATLESTRNFNGHNCSVPSHGGPESLTNSRTISPLIRPSQLWNVFMLFCFASALSPPLVFVCTWLIFTDEPPLESARLPQQKLALTVYEWSNTSLSTLLQLFVPTPIWLCFVDHSTV